MTDGLDVRLLRRVLGEKRHHTSIRTLYGDRTWVDDLDIVNELGAHTGCVNALSWSSGGNLLASGSDDTYLNIWEFNPANSARPFTLNTSVSTGHHANIFSVKFMPHSNDRTVITCAGDSQVRVFDLEHSRASQDTTQDLEHSASTRSKRFNKFFPNATWLHEGNTNARVYRSHADRAKRIVTESSPHLFLTCSEDGEVRQWDLRQPSSAYPPPRSRGAGHSRAYSGDDEVSSNVPPPLISYRKYGLDLNSISCSAGQPQYIALGGAHLHCFLHDRRMLGRDLATERGQSAGTTPTPGTSDDEVMYAATRCVKRFAPNGKRKMRLHDRGHITACKISDANPNEMIASWSGDYIYSFDIVQSPDARDAETQSHRAYEAERLKDRKDRKRKRAHVTASSSSLAQVKKQPRRSASAEEPDETDETAVSLRQELVGSTESQANANAEDSGAGNAQVGHDDLLVEAERVGERVAHALVRLRYTLFDFSTVVDDVASLETSHELTAHTDVFTSVLGQCSVLLPQMDEIIRGWSYPVNPSEEDVRLQTTLRRNRQASWRFVQASGCLARTLGGRLQTLSSTPDPRLAYFDGIQPAPREERAIDDTQRFCYDFLKAILHWVRDGKEAVWTAFQKPPGQNPETQRYPLSPADGEDNHTKKLLDYLHSMASEQPLVDVDANRFERDETRVIFATQKVAVTSFMRALNNTQLRTNGDAVATEIEDQSLSGQPKRAALHVMDRGAAARFWACKVGRSLLMTAAEGINFDFVTRAFGGLRLCPSHDLEGGRSQEDVGTDEGGDSLPAEHPVDGQPEVAEQLSANPESMIQEPVTIAEQITQELTAESSNIDAEARVIPTVFVEVADDGHEEVPHGDEGDEDNENDQSEDSRSEADSDQDAAPAHPLFRRQRGYGRPRERASVNSHVPYSSHTRMYRGHCNTRTVKDVNYYGLNDEYVVSGSDDGHFFIWDRKTAEVVNILQGDGEVVNVVQGHPYEPMIACSGIDSTVKIFGVGAREREDAELGVGIANPGTSVHSSLRLGGRRARVARLASDEHDDKEDGGERPREGLKSRKAMHRNYEIMNQNDAARRQDDTETFMTEDMLARVAVILQQRRMGGADLSLDDISDVVVSQNCCVM